MKDLYQKNIIASGNSLIIYTDDFSKMAIAKFSFDFILESVFPLKLKNKPQKNDKILLF